jgi:hypothetical protein
MPDFWNGTSRVMLLGLVTALFVAAWSFDNQSATVRPAGDPVAQLAATMVEPAAVDAVEIVPAPPSSAESCEVVPTGATETVGTDSVSPDSEDTGASARLCAAEMAFAAEPGSEGVPTVANCSIPLPADIAPGRYRVVDNKGRTHTISLTGDDIIREGVATGLPPRDVYVQREGDRRWYFIRIDEDEEAVQTAASLMSAVPRQQLGTAPVAADWQSQATWPAVVNWLETRNREFRQWAAGIADRHDRASVERNSFRSLH